LTTVIKADKNNNDQNLNKKWNEGEIKEWKSKRKTAIALLLEYFCSPDFTGNL